jgi:hypothetical protein
MMTLFLIAPVDAATSSRVDETTDYVDNNSSNVDSSADEGTHSSFSDQQSAPDSTYDALIEEDTGGGGGSGVTIEDYVDQISDVDSSEDEGTHDVFADMQASDNTYNNITEEGGGAPAEDQETFTTGTNMVDESTNWYTDLWLQDLTDTTDWWLGDSAGTTSSGTGAAAPQTGTFFAYTETSSSNYGNRSIYTVNSYDFGSAVSGEIQFYLNMFPTTITATIVLAYNATGSWVNVWSMDATTLNTPDQNTWTFQNVDLTSQTGTGHLQFRVDSLTADSFSADISLDTITIVVEAATDFQMDMEMQFTGVFNVTDTAKLCIETGTFYGSEDINVTIRTDGDAWQTIYSDLTASTWNNYTLSGPRSQSSSVVLLRLQTRFRMDGKSTRCCSSFRELGHWMSMSITIRQMLTLRQM